MFRRAFKFIYRRRRKRDREEDEERKRSPSSSSSKEDSKEQKTPVKSDEPAKKEGEAEDELYTVQQPEGATSAFPVGNWSSKGAEKRIGEEPTTAYMTTQEPETATPRKEKQDSEEKGEGVIESTKVKLRKIASIRKRKGAVTIGGSDETKTAMVQLTPPPLRKKSTQRDKKKAAKDKKGNVEDEEQKMETRAVPNVTIPEMYRKKLKKPSPPPPPPPIPDEDKKESEEEVDYWLYPDGKPKKNFEISEIPSKGDFLLRDTNAVSAAKSALSKPPELPDSYGVADRPVLQKSKDQGPPSTTKQPKQVAEIPKKSPDVPPYPVPPTKKPDYFSTAPAKPPPSFKGFLPQQPNYFPGPPAPSYPPVPPPQPPYFSPGPSPKPAYPTESSPPQPYIPPAPPPKPAQFPGSSPQQPNYFPGPPAKPAGYLGGSSPQQPNYFAPPPAGPPNYFAEQPLKQPRPPVPPPQGVPQVVAEPPRKPDQRFTPPAKHTLSATSDYFRPPGAQ